MPFALCVFSEMTKGAKVIYASEPPSDAYVRVCWLLSLKI